MVDEKAEGGPTRGHRVRVSTEVGDCSFCDRKRLRVIAAYDKRIYEGWACPDCILEGKVSEKFKPGDRIMGSIVFVAKGLKGIQPFANCLAAINAQKDLGPEKAILVAKEQQVRIQNRIRATLGNRAQRRAAVAKNRKGGPNGSG